MSLSKPNSFQSACYEIYASQSVKNRISGQKVRIRLQTVYPMYNFGVLESSHYNVNFLYKKQKTETILDWAVMHIFHSRHFESYNSKRTVKLKKYYYVNEDYRNIYSV